MNHDKNFTVGPLKQRIIMFAVPIALSSIIQQLFNVADSAIVGKFSGSLAMAAVGDNAPIINMFIALFVGLSIGANVVISRLIGNNNPSNIYKAIYTIFAVAIISGLFLLGICIVTARKMLLLIGTPNDVLELAVLYLKLYALGMPALMIYNFVSAILRGLGDSKSPTISIIISGIVNVILNLVFVCVLEAGVAGVAIATDIANYLSGVIVVICLKKHITRFDIKHAFQVNHAYLIEILKHGIPAGIQGIVFALSNMLIQSAINSFGEKAIAGASIAFNFECIGYYVINAFNQAAVTFTGQNSSVKEYSRCKQIFTFTVTAGMFCCFFINGLFWLFQKDILSLFTSDELVIQYAMIRFSTVLVFQWIAGAYEIAGSAMRGMGHSYIPSVLTIIGTCIMRIIWVTVFFPLHKNYSFLLIVYPITWLITSIMVVIAYYLTRRKDFREC